MEQKEHNKTEIHLGDYIDHMDHKRQAAGLHDRLIFDGFKMNSVQLL